MTPVYSGTRLAKSEGAIKTLAPSKQHPLRAGKVESDAMIEDLTARQKAGGSAAAFWVVRQKQVAIVKFNDGSEVGPFKFGVHWGPNADPDLCRKLAGVLFRLGLMDEAIDEEHAYRTLCDESMADVVNQVFPCDFPAELRV